MNKCNQCGDNIGDCHWALRITDDNTEIWWCADECYEKGVKGER